MTARRWPQRPLALVASIVLAAGGLGGCGAGRNILGTNTSPCFMALPVAKQAVAGRGSLTGVRRVDIAKLTSASGRALRAMLNLLPVPPPPDICLVAYAGSFTPGQVEQFAGIPPPAGVGRYAIVVVSLPEATLLGTFVLLREPLSFTRAHVGF
jgi:hypothetical protein